LFKPAELPEENRDGVLEPGRDLLVRRLGRLSQRQAMFTGWSRDALVDER
jgi:hypothetical protein